MLVGTVVDMWQYTNPFPPLSKQKDDTMIFKILKSFSIYTNGKIILSTNTGKNHINCLAGIRAITMCWIIYGHLYQRGMELVSSGIIQNRQFLTDVRYFLLILSHLLSMFDLGYQWKRRLGVPDYHKCNVFCWYILLHEWTLDNIYDISRAWKEEIQSPPILYSSIH